LKKTEKERKKEKKEEAVGCSEKRCLYYYRAKQNIYCSKVCHSVQGCPSDKGMPEEM